MANTAAKKLTYDSKPVQVESAIRDGTGKIIADTYYVKPSAGIPKTDLASAVQTSLGLADTASQTDENVKQTEDTSTNSAIPIVLKNVSTSGTAGTVKYAPRLTFNPSTRTIAVQNSAGSGNVASMDGNGYIVGTWLRGTSNNHLGSAPPKIAVQDSSGWIYNRTLAETVTDLGIDLKAPLASPALTGTPTAPTATAGTNTTQIATTAFVQTAITNSNPLNATDVTVTEVD